MLRLVILGSTGSVGQTALKVAADLGDMIQVVGLAGGQRGDVLARQARETGAERTAMLEAGRDSWESASESRGLPNPALGPFAMEDMVRDLEPDIVLVAVGGAVALPYVLAAVDCAGRIALANKESLVMAGGLIQERARRSGCKVIPVDSEHSGVFQLLDGLDPAYVDRVVLTASGGPFRGRSERELEAVTPQEAVIHPVWPMGRKISVDSATLMNKALELVEAHWLFGLPAESLGVVVHPQAIVHALVECCDGTFMAHLGEPDMSLPVRFALTWPSRCRSSAPRLDLVSRGALSFEAPAPRMSRAVRLGFRAIEEGGGAGAVLNAANEVAVTEFLAGRLGFAAIVPLVEQVLDNYETGPVSGIKDALRADAWARQEAHRCLCCTQ